MQINLEPLISFKQRIHSPVVINDTPMSDSHVQNILCKNRNFTRFK